MDEHDRTIRNLTYARFVALGRAPTPEEVAVGGGPSQAEILASWRRLHDEHALVLDPSGDEIWMANPFSGVPTPYRVHADGRWWFANCAWDAFGICAALHVDGRIETARPDCGEGLAVEDRYLQPDDASLLFHCLVAAARWWDDIVFT